MATINDPNNASNIQTVKAASTAAAATDMPAVVTIHPNSVAPGTTLTTATGVGGAMRVTPWGELRIQPDSTQLLVDTFDTGPIDTTNTWNAPTTGGTGTAFAFSTASMTGGSGTTANSFSMIATQTSFQPSSPGLIEFQSNINIEFPVLTNAVRFWGFASAPGSPTAALPLTNASGFFLDTAGKLWAVCYQSGTRVNIQDLSSSGNNKQPLDSSAHKYYVYYRSDVAYFAIDDRDNVVATAPTGATGPDVTTLPVRYLTVAGAAPPVSSATIVVNNTVVGDTAGNNIALCDPTFPWRQASVKAASTAVAATDLPLVVGLHPSSPARIVGNAGAAVDAAAGAAAPANVVFGALAQIGATAAATAAAGVLKVGIVGSANAAVDGAIGAVPPANALQVGAKVATANPANATAGNQAALMVDKAGRLVVTPSHVRDLMGIQATTIAAASVAETTIVTAGGAGVFLDITSIIITTTNAVAATLTLRDATAGTTRAILDYPNAAVVPGTPLQMNFLPPLVQAAANTAWTLQPSANANGVHITVVFAKNT